MKVNFLSNTNPISAIGLATIFESNVIVRADDEQPEAFETFNINDYDCCYEELAFAELDPLKDRNWKSDKKGFLFRLSIPTDTVTIELFKCDISNEVLIATLNDNTLGTFFPLSFFQNLEVPQLKIGFLLDWKKVLDIHGPGRYFIKADREIINRNSTLESHIFRLMPYNEFAADGTVRFQVFSSGFIEGGINYLGFEWEDMIRLKGKFWTPDPTLETDTYLTPPPERTITQIQDSIITDYTFESRAIPVDIWKPLIYDRILGNRILVTDYNLFNSDKYRDFKVYPKEIKELKPGNRTANMTLKLGFTDKVQNIIKRNVT